MVIQYNPELTPRREDKHVLIDADCVAYWGAATCDDQGEGPAFLRVNLRMNQILDECRASAYTAYLTGKNNFQGWYCHSPKVQGKQVPIRWHQDNTSTEVFTGMPGIHYRRI